MKFDEPFDVVWSIESISHYPQREKFFAAAAQCLKPHGTLAIIDWFKRELLTKREYEKFVQPIEKSMLCELNTIDDYTEFLSSNGFQVLRCEVLNEHCAKTWDFCLDLLKNKALWRIAAENGSKFVDFLRGFRSMRAGFATGNFIYGLIIAKRI
jgi:cyclopropane fatty-acyl-phospholipid synthase-like methyltransferase